VRVDLAIDLRITQGALDPLGQGERYMSTGQALERADAARQAGLACQIDG